MPDPDPTSLRLLREIQAQPLEVYRAWLEPERFRHWFRPLGQFSADEVFSEPRAGGAWRAEFTLADGAPMRIEGRWLELSPGRRLVFELRTPLCAEALTVTVTFEASGTGTRFQLVQEHLSPQLRALFEAAWTQSFDRLLGACPDALGAFYANFDQHPRFRSRFGGLWPDLSDAPARIAGKRALGQLDAEDAARFSHWLEQGYVVLPRAVDPGACDRLRAEVDERWDRGDPAVRVAYFDGHHSFAGMDPRLRDRPHKLLDYHATSPLARDLAFAPSIRRFLEQLFERPAMAFQSLLFRWGTEQAMHQDTAYVRLRSPMEFVGCWIALEDIQEGSGELQYFEGSHRIPEYLWFDRARGMPDGYVDDAEFLRLVEERSVRQGCSVRRFLPKQGDALIWHADLAHGGAPRVRRELTRWSLVTHFCPHNVEPIYTVTNPGPPPREHAPGCWYRHEGR